MTWLSWILSVTFLITIGLLVWYIKNLIARVYFYVEDIKSIKKLIKEYYKHIETLHSMEMFYGDPTLESLMEHTKFLTKELKSFENVFENIDIQNEEIEENSDAGTDEIEKER